MLDGFSHSPNSIIARQRVRARGLRRLAPFWRAIRLVILSIGLFLFSVSLSVVTAFVGKAFWYFISRSSYFQMTEIHASGLSDEVLEEIRQVAGLGPEYKRNLLFINDRSLERYILNHPRIRNVSVEKQYPRGLYITGEERQTAAIVLTTRSGAYAIDEWGAVLGEVRIRALEREFPYITGVSAEDVEPGRILKTPHLDNALIMLTALRKEDWPVYGRVSEVHLDRNKGLVMYLREGVKVVFGPGRAVDKLPRLILFLEENSQQLPQVIDLSFENMIVVRNGETKAP